MNELSDLSESILKNIKKVYPNLSWKFSESCELKSKEKPEIKIMFSYSGYRKKEGEKSASKYNPDDIVIKVGETIMDWENETLSQAINRELERKNHEI